MSGSPERFPRDILHQLWKEDVLRDSPLLSAYLDPESPTQEWVDEVSAQTEDYNSHFEDLFGHQWKAFMLTSLLMLSYQNNLFFAHAKEFDKEKHTELTTTQVVFMGYEIGVNKVMLEAFIPDLTQKIATFHTFNKARDTETLSSFVQIGLYSGANFKELSTKRIPAAEMGEPIPVDDQRLTPFRSFINELDI